MGCGIVQKWNLISFALLIRHGRVGKYVTILYKYIRVQYIHSLKMDLMLNSNLFCTCLYNNSILKNKTMVKKQALTCNQYILIIVFLDQIQVWLFVKLFAAKTTISHLRISSLSNLTNLLLPNLFFRYNEDVFNAGCYTIQLRIFGGCRMRPVA